MNYKATDPASGMKDPHRWCHVHTVASVLLVPTAMEAHIVYEVGVVWIFMDRLFPSPTNSVCAVYHLCVMTCSLLITQARVCYGKLENGA